MENTAKTNETIIVPDNISMIVMMIRKDWKNVHYSALPYLNAMATLNTIQDYYGYDSAQGIIIRFVGNAGTWRGEVAKAVKTKLREMIK